MIFDPGPHEYWNDARTVLYPSVTQVLKRAGVIDDRWYSAEACERGSAVHELCERYARGERYDRQGRELASLEYVNAFAAWMAATGAYAIVTEAIVHGSHNGKMWAGKFDGLYEIGGKRVLIDIKTGAPCKWHALQLSAYALSSFDGGYKVNPDRCAALYLRADGTYKEDRLSGARLLEGIDGFKAALQF